MTVFIDYGLAIILGLVQGVTEFLPISSSGHLVILHDVLNFDLTSNLAFDVALHAGTLGALIIFFAKDIIHYLRYSPKFIGLLLLSSIPAGVAGVVFENVIVSQLQSSWVVVIMLLVVAGWFFFVESGYRPRFQLQQLHWTQALLIGCVQIVALIPGTSRSGITMSTAMLLGFDRTSAARWSFLMTIPLLFGATVKKSYDISQTSIPTSEVILMLLGAVVAFGSGLIAIRWLLQFFQRSSLRPFAWYRIGLAIVVGLGLLLY